MELRWKLSGPGNHFMRNTGRLLAARMFLHITYIWFIGSIVA